MFFFFFFFVNPSEGAGAALSLSGTMLGFYPVRVLPSKTAIAPVNPAFLPRVGCGPILFSYVHWKLMALDNEVPFFILQLIAVSVASLKSNERCVPGPSIVQILIKRLIINCISLVSMKY